MCAVLIDEFLVCNTRNTRRGAQLAYFKQRFKNACTGMIASDPPRPYPAPLIGKDFVGRKLLREGHGGGAAFLGRRPMRWGLGTRRTHWRVHDF